MTEAGKTVPDPASAVQTGLKALAASVRSDTTVFVIVSNISSRIFNNQIDPTGAATNPAQQCKLENNPLIPLDEVKALADDERSDLSDDLRRITVY